MSNTAADLTAPPLPPPAFPGVVVVDDREKLAYTFDRIVADRREGYGFLTVPTVTGHLVSGDYSLVGFEDMVAVERKSLCDLFSTLGSNRSRFERELRRLAVLDFAAVVIEAEWSEVLGFPPLRSSLPPKTVIRSVMAWQVRFPRVHWWTVPGRSVGEAVTFRILDRFYREHEANK